jgi:hypothetical protein
MMYAIAPGQARIADLYRQGEALRDTVLKRARLCALLTNPMVLPPENYTEDDKTPESFQSLGTTGLTNIAGRMLLSLFPPGQPWFTFTIPKKFLTDNSPEHVARMRQLDATLEVCEKVVASLIERAGTSHDMRDRLPSGFLTRKRQALEQILVTGETLEHMRDDFRIRVFRRDQYVTTRDDAGEVVMHAICEKVDPLTLSPKDAEDAGIDIEACRRKTYAERVLPLYTAVEWQPYSKRWLITQEINGRELTERVDDPAISPFFSTAYSIAPGQHYGRGFVDLCIGDLRSFNEMTERSLDIAHVASLVLMFKDQASNIKTRDLQSPPGGVVLGGRVVGGQVQDIALWQSQKGGDFGILANIMGSLQARIARSFLLESAVQPTGERVTATQIERIALELQGATGGVYANISDQQQIPMLRRAVFQAVKARLMPPINELVADMQILTGASALAQAERATRAISFTQAVAALGEQALARLNTSVLVDILARSARIDAPGLVKSEEEVQAERDRAMAAQVAADSTTATVQSLAQAVATQATQQGVSP